MKFFYVLFSVVLFSCVNKTVEKKQTEDPIIIVSHQIENNITNDSLYVERAKINIENIKPVTTI